MYYLHLQLKTLQKFTEEKYNLFDRHFNFILIIFIPLYYLFHCYYCNVNYYFYSFSRKIHNLHSDIVIFAKAMKKSFFRVLT